MEFEKLMDSIHVVYVICFDFLRAMSVNCLDLRNFSRKVICIGRYISFKRTAIHE